MLPKNMSGLAFLKAISNGEIPHPSIAETMNMQFSEIEAGRVMFLAQADERHINPAGGVHGGFAATILDSVTGCAVHSMLEAGIPYGTIDLTVKMMRPIPVGVPLFAEGKVINISRSLGVSDGSIRDEQGKIYAHATCTCMIIRDKQ